MHNTHFKRYFFMAGIILLVPVAGLWSWNTLSEIFTLPQAGYRHMLAAFTLLLILKWMFIPGRDRRNYACGERQDNPDS